MSNYEIAALEEIDEIDDGRCPFRPVRHRFGICAFGANAFGPRRAGERLINEHDEGEGDSQEELYLVTQGRARFEIGGETVEAAAGSFVFVQPGVTRTAFAEEDGTTVFVVGAKAGEAYKPHGFEYWAPLHKLFEAGDYATVADRGAEMLAADAPPYAGLYYNVACAESLAGRPDDALDHLRRAFELDDEIRDWAKRDSDFAALHDDPRFKELVGG
jgi:tetratricopeptide (TPR) repeat protein